MMTLWWQDYKDEKKHAKTQMNFYSTIYIKDGIMIAVDI